MDETIIDDYKQCVISGDYGLFKNICVFLETIHNQLKDKKYIHMKDVLTRVHKNVKT